MKAIISNGQIALFVPPNTPFNWDGIQYPANWCNLATQEQKSQIGLVDVVYSQYPNDEFYWVTQNAPVYNGQNVSITYSAIAKDLDQCKKVMINNVNKTAWGNLSPSDWMVVKAFESSSNVPTLWSTWRAGIRAQAQHQVGLINACTTVDELAALPNVEWAHDPNYVAPVVNPV